jgi:nitrogen-specific signal transduction histidine kinase
VRLTPIFGADAALAREVCAGLEGRAWAALPADRHGVIEVNSGPGKAEFVVTLPLAAVSNTGGCVRSSL